MFQFINDILIQFMPCFKRVKTWLSFVCIVIGFIVRTDTRGITSIISALRMKPQRYSSLLKFFRSQAFSLHDLYKKLISIIQKYILIQVINNHIVLAGDHIKITKEGRHMPCIQKWYQESDNSGKCGYIDGHNFGFVSMLTKDVVRSIPIMAEIQESKAKNGGDSIIKQMVEMAGKAAESLDKPAVILLDAYFFSGMALQSAAQFKDNEGHSILKIITRAKRGAVGYTLPPERTGKKGRPRLYGTKVSLSEVFTECAADFTKTTMKLYDKKTVVEYKCLDLIWKPAKQVVRFVLTKIAGRPFILMSSDCTFSGEEIIKLYTERFKIEGMFKEFKHELGGFDYHFWTGALERRKRGGATVVPTAEGLAKLVTQAKQAIEVYVCLHCVAQAILSGVALVHSQDIWGRFRGWLRTVRTKQPTIMVTKQVISQDFQVFSSNLARLPVFKAVLDVQRSEEFLYKMSG
jgi:hypothetical protein